MNIILKATTMLVAGIASVVVAGAAMAAGVNGAGGTAIYPVLAIWAKKYADKNSINVNYQAIGSGGGINQITAGTVDFGNSDKPLMHDDLIKRKLVQFPEVVISIVPVIHLTNIQPGQLVLDGPTLANIYLGKIAMWDDAAIKALNPGVALPNMAIVPVHRADGSGTTFNFTDYLGKVSPEWKTKVGADTAVSWPGASDVAGKGNAGVASSVQQIMGSIGYVEYAYAKQNNLIYTDLVNAEGKRVKPTPEAFQSAAANADFSKVQDFYLILTNQPGAASWPITAATYMLMRSDYTPARNKEVLKFLNYGLHDGQVDSTGLDYVPFPDAVVKQIEASWTQNLKAWP